MALAERAKLITELGLVDKLTPGLNKAKGVVNTLGRHQRALGIGAAAVGGAVTAGLIGAARAAIDWQDAFQGVVKTVDEADLKSVGSDFGKLAEQLREMSREMPITANELAGIAENAGALGVKAKDIASFTKTVAMLASTTDVSADQAATSLGQLTNVIRLTGDEYDNFGAALVDLGNKGASTESQILQITSRAGAGAALVGVAKDATLGWAAAVANLGIEAEAGGTSLQSFFLRTQKSVGKGGVQLATLAKTAGVSAATFKKAYGKDATGALQSFLKGLGKLNATQRLDVLEKLGLGDVRMSRMVLGLAGNTAGLADSLTTASKAWKENTALQAEFDKRAQTVKSSLTMLRNNVNDAAITVGEGFAPALGNAAKKLSAFLKIPENRAALKKLGEDIGKIVEGVDWNGLLNSAKSLIGVFEKLSVPVRALWDVFSAMPTDVKALLLGLAGVNKITGGAVGSIVGELGKGLIRGVLGLNAGVVNAKAGVVNVVGGAGGIGGAAAGAGGVAGGGRLGKIGGAAAAIGKVVMVGMAVGVAAELAGALGAQSTEIRAQGEGLKAQAKTFTEDPSTSRKAIVAAINTIDDQMRDPFNSLALSITDPLNGGKAALEKTRAELAAKLDALNAADAATNDKLEANRSAINGTTRVAAQMAAKEAVTNDRLEANRAATFAAGTRQKQAIDIQRAALAGRLDLVRGMVAAQVGKTAQVVGAVGGVRATIAAKNFSPTIRVTVPVTTNVSVRAVTQAQKISASYNSRYGTGDARNLDRG